MLYVALLPDSHTPKCQGETMLRGTWIFAQGNLIKSQNAKTQKNGFFILGDTNHWRKNLYILNKKPK